MTVQRGSQQGNSHKSKNGDKKSNINKYSPGFFGPGILSFYKNKNSKKNPHNKGRYFLGVPAPVFSPAEFCPDRSYYKRSEGKKEITEGGKDKAHFFCSFIFCRKKLM